MHLSWEQRLYFFFFVILHDSYMALCMQWTSHNYKVLKMFMLPRNKRDWNQYYLLKLSRAFFHSFSHSVMGAFTGHFTKNF